MKLARWFGNVLVAVALAFPLTGAIAGSTAETVGCTPEAKSALKDALTIAQVACIVGTEFVDDDKVMDVCRIEEALRPAVEALLAQKRAARRAGACAADAGAKDQ